MCVSFAEFSASMLVSGAIFLVTFARTVMYADGIHSFLNGSVYE